MGFAASFRPNMGCLEELARWQRMEFPSPYLEATRFEVADPKAPQCVVAALHELLSLTMEKTMTSAQLDAFHSEFLLPSRLPFFLLFINHRGTFYIANKGARSKLLLKDAYDGSNLIKKCPLLLFHGKFVALSGRAPIDSCSASSKLFTELCFAYFYDKCNSIGDM